MNFCTANVKALIITVNYRGAADTLRLLESLRRLKGFSGIDVTVVDNFSADGSSSAIRAAMSTLENVRLLESTINRGYFGGAKWALREYTCGGNSVPDWVVVCNNDIVIEDQDFLAKLFAHDPAAVGALAPEIRSERTKLDQNPFLKKRPDKKKLLTLRIWFSSYYLMLFKELLSAPVRLGKEKLSNFMASPQKTPQGQELQSIYSPHGAFVIFSRKYFELGGEIDDGLVLYAEEFSVGEICRRLGLPVLHDKKLQVQHREHSSTRSQLTQPTYRRKREALHYVIAKYLSDLA
jgi:GT2 family glycosyltransferase